MEKTDKVKKERIQVYMLPWRKQKVQEIAEELGLSDSMLLVQCFNFWCQHNPAYSKRQHE